MRIRISNQQKVKIDEKNIEKLVRFVMSYEGIKYGRVEISVLLVDDKKITKINSRYLGRRRVTDVISFRMWEGHFHALHPEILGDVVVNVQQARRCGVLFQKELALYIVHGLLHLLGYVDDTNKNAVIMQKRCEEILKCWGKKNIQYTGC